MGMTDLEEAAVLDDRLDNQRGAGAGGYTIGLSSTLPAKDGTNVTEPVEASYARVAIALTDWAAAVAGDPTEKANDVAFTFPQAAEDWAAGADLVAWVIFDDTVANGGGAPRWFAPLDIAKPVLTGDTASLGVGDVVAKLGATDDVF